jgi:hypothetical protein
MIRRAVLTFALALLLAAPASAQSIWLDREHRPSALVEIEFPTFDGADSNFPTWTWFAATRLPLGRTTSFVGELPYAHGSFGSGLSEVSEATVGNPYLGIECAAHPTGPRFELGARLPLASDDKLIPFVVGYYTDVERQQAFVPDQVPVRLGIHYHHAPEGGARVAWDLRLVPAVWIKTKDGFLSDSEVFLGYGGLVRYEGEQVRVGGGLTGRWNVTNDGADFGEASNHQLDLAADFLSGSVRPGIQIKLPLDSELTNTLDSVFGVSVTILP